MGNCSHRKVAYTSNFRSGMQLLHLRLNCTESIYVNVSNAPLHSVLCRRYKTVLLDSSSAVCFVDHYSKSVFIDHFFYIICTWCWMGIRLWMSFLVWGDYWTGMTLILDEYGVHHAFWESSFGIRLIGRDRFPVLNVLSVTVVAAATPIGFFAPRLIT